MKNNKSIHKFVGDQLSRWPLACDNFRALKNVRVREMEIGGLTVKLQFNPARMISSAAKLNKDDIARRRCFLCRENRPDEQIMMKFDGRKGKRYHILVNPYPIFPDHLVIAMNRHVEQSILHRYVDMLDMARKYTGYTFFYNGPKSGASAPDHHHFQAAPSGSMPLVNDVDRLFGAMIPIASIQDARLYHYNGFTTGVFALRAETVKSAAKLFYRLLDCAEVPEGEKEPLFNLFSYWKEGEFRSVVVFRSRHRSHHYFSDGPDHLTMSPGCADMGGVFIVPVEEEYERLSPELLEEMVNEVSITQQEQDRIIDRLSRTQPELHVGIMSAKELEFEILSDGAGARKAVMREGKIEYDGALYEPEHPAALASFHQLLEKQKDTIRKIKGKKWIGIAPGARWDSKQWEPEFFARMIRYMAQKQPDSVFFIFGSADEAASAGIILENTGNIPVINLTGMTGMLQLVEGIRAMDLLIANDSGPMHIAASAGTPVAAFFGPTRPDLTGPYTERKRIFQPQLTCICCFKRYCESKECHRAIDPDAAAEQSLTLMEEISRP